MGLCDEKAQNTSLPPRRRRPAVCPWPVARSASSRDPCAPANVSPYPDDRPRGARASVDPARDDPSGSSRVAPSAIASGRLVARVSPPCASAAPRSSRGDEPATYS